MKIIFSQKFDRTNDAEEDFTPVTLKECIEKTRQALDIAYTGFNNAVDVDLIDSYIYEINSLQLRYKHLTDLAALEPESDVTKSDIHSPVRALVSHVFS